MIDDSKPYWGRPYQVSSADLADLRRMWADAGRQVWDAATRAGRNIKARTEQELEALGRAHLEQAEAEREQAKAVRQTVGAVLGAGRDAVRRGVAAVGPKVQAVAKAQAGMAQVRQAQQVRAADSVGRFVAMPPAPFLRRGTPTDPGPGRLYEEFRTGEGPERRTLGPESSFSREFVQAPAVQDYIRESLGNWRRENGGVDMYVNPRRRDFGVTEFVKDAAAGNGASHVIGTFGMAGERRGDRIDWWAENDMGRRSYYGGRILDKVGLPNPTDNRSRPGPQGTTHQTILFSTDLNGRPLP